MNELAIKADELHKINGKLSGIGPLLRMLSDAGGGTEWADTGDALEAIAGLADSLVGELCDIATSLEKMQA